MVRRSNTHGPVLNLHPHPRCERLPTFFRLDFTSTSSRICRKRGLCVLVERKFQPRTSIRITPRFLLRVAWSLVVVSTCLFAPGGVALLGVGKGGGKRFHPLCLRCKPTVVLPGLWTNAASWSRENQETFIFFDGR